METLYAGTSRIEITPPLSVPYLGYVPRQAYFEGVHDPLHARALVVSDGRKEVAVIAVDAIGFSDRILGPGRSFRAEFLRAVEARTGIGPEQVMLAASHAHSTPETLDITPLYEVEGAVAWLEQLCKQLAEVTAEAQEKMQPARVKWGKGCARGIAVNRRQLLRDGRLYQPSMGTPSSPIVRPGEVDEEVGMLLFEFEDGAYSVLCNFTCHPVSVQVQPLVSADYPGAACRLVEETAPGCRHCLFTQGAAGDVNPVGGGQRRDFGEAARYGQILGGELLKLAARLRAPGTGELPPVVDAAVEEVGLSVRDLPDPEPYRQAAARARAEADRAEREEERFSRLNQARAAEEALRVIGMGSDPVQSLVQVVRIGEVGLVGCPGELFVSLGREIKQQAAAPGVMVVGYANDYVGYLSTPIAFEEGGYETALGPWCRIGPEGGRRVVDAGLRLVLRLWRE